MTTQPAGRPWAEAVFAAVGPQPDRRSCGAACLVVARMLAHPGFARRVTGPAWSDTVLAEHRRAVRIVARRPWPRALGTPPWTLARELSDLGSRYRTVVTRGGPAVGWQVAAALDAGFPVGWYLGSRWLPRHVALLVGYDDRSWQVFEPGAGRVLTLPRRALDTGPRRVGGWRESWAVVLPDGDRQARAA